VETSRWERRGRIDKRRQKTRRNKKRRNKKTREEIENRRGKGV